MRTIIFAMTVVLAWLPGKAIAAANVYITSTAEDSVGQSIVYNLRDQINRSSLYNVVYNRDDAGFVINIVTIKQNDGNSSAYSAVLTIPPFDGKGLDYFVTNVVGYCGSSVTTSCAARILSSMDDDMTSVISSFDKAFRKPK